GNEGQPRLTELVNSLESETPSSFRHQQPHKNFTTKVTKNTKSSSRGTA
ncbi:MAG: hypothetical protein ACI9OU_002169, partial [Candidatus Promineifilaceae bacterium]